MLIYEILDVTGYAAANDILGMVAGYCLTLVFVCTILMPILTTGMLHKIRLRKLRLVGKLVDYLGIDE